MADDAQWRRHVAERAVILSLLAFLLSIVLGGVISYFVALNTDKKDVDCDERVRTAVSTFGTGMSAGAGFGLLIAIIVGISVALHAHMKTNRITPAAQA